MNLLTILLGKMYYTLDSLKVLEEHKAKKNRKWYKVGEEFLSCVDFTGMDVVNETADEERRLVIGERYSLTGSPCEGFQMDERIYELIGKVDTFNGVDVNSLIVKQVGGMESVKFALSKSDCDDIGIEYQKGLILLPRDLSWKHVHETIPFNPLDVSTSPLSEKDDTIRYVLLEVKGFKDYNRGFVMTPNKMLLKEDDLANSLRVVTKRPIVYGRDGLKINEGVDLARSIAYPKSPFFIFNNGNFIASNGSMYILINLTRFDNDENRNRGVDPTYIEGLHPYDLFTIMWDEKDAYTLDEIKKKNEEIEMRKRRKEEVTAKAMVAMEGQIESSISRLTSSVGAVIPSSYSFIVPVFDREMERLDKEMERLTVFNNVHDRWQQILIK